MLIRSQNRAFSRRKIITMTAALWAASLAAMPQALAMTPQEQHVATVAGNVMSLANSGRRGVALRNDVAALLIRSSDINGIARFALGRYRSKLPKAKRHEYNRAVLIYVAGLFARYADDFVGSGVKIKASRKTGKFILVESSVHLARGGSTTLRWRLRANGNYRKIADINFRGIWLSLRLRDAFVSVLNKNNGDFGALLDYLRVNS